MDDLDFLENASASFTDLEQNGSPIMPLPFDQPQVGRAMRVDAPVYNPHTQGVLKVSNIIYEHHMDGSPPARAYWVGRKLKRCIFGVVKECTILRFRNDPEIPWEVTEHKAAGKIMSWQKIKEVQHIEDPQKEVAAMQYISSGGGHPHVMGALDVLQDEEYLLLFMPYCTSGDLFGFVRQAGRFPENMARYWFTQILDGLSYLQRMGVCHRDMSLENILVDEYTRSVVIDLGMCLRVPYDNGEGIGGVSSGGLRRLIRPLIPCGKPNYISPEILSSDQPFDGFAIDLWATGVILFIMLVGLPPWEFARQEDPRYRMVIKGKLSIMLDSWDKSVSPLAADLLQKMLMEDPRQRLSLTEVKDHPWVVDEIPAYSDSTMYHEGGVSTGHNNDEGWRT
mmetsp:Transcript_16115/g.33090  ORF Transcript_16115/g.33090 Transcript_16115/m.33090 type:complete len:394 (-) Transcript_16115:191-1372(-)|eukprot:CAMPEP_0201116602 /NCGR_PEP_ID=MMETSP0850-20130426/815_1 /ASSEMBLY_ACC=CAM_ASM_000622 /TAXON_ID=183588 /ORGANISM="Pseudo-nitzschia fraudulenta, Strain WWA7" /LENGTH=393 /DNA_ID=CAMNT_0047380711 /DNA_START=460 /DNA_END=1641 /DNA_ORIENTATION=+